MLNQTTRTALLGTVAAFAFGGAQAQTTQQSQLQTQAGGDRVSEACVVLAERLADETGIEAETRTEVENIIAAGDLTQCHVVFTAWENEGAIDRDTLELVGTDQVSERMIVQQEVEVDADVAVYQPPVEIGVDTGTPEVVWAMPRQSATIHEEAPQITVRQAQPTIHVEVPQPRITVTIPEPEISVIWPESTLEMSRAEPQIEVRMPEPVVTVNMPDPIIELSIGGTGHSDLVQMDDGRFAPQGTTADDLEPRISLQGQAATVTPAQEPEAPEVIFNRAEPQVVFEGHDPEVTVEIVGDPVVRIDTGRQDRRTDDTAGRDDTTGKGMTGEGTMGDNAAPAQDAPARN